MKIDNINKYFIIMGILVFYTSCGPSTEELQIKLQIKWREYSGNKLENKLSQIISQTFKGQKKGLSEIKVLERIYVPSKTIGDTWHREHYREIEHDFTYYVGRNINSESWKILTPQQKAEPIYGTDYVTDGCNLPDKTLYLTDDGSILYNSSVTFDKISFNVDDATVRNWKTGESCNYVEIYKFCGLSACSKSCGYIRMVSEFATIRGYSADSDSSKIILAGMCECGINWMQNNKFPSIPPGCGTLVKLNLTYKGLNRDEYYKYPNYPTYKWTEKVGPYNADGKLVYKRNQNGSAYMSIPGGRSAKEDGSWTVKWAGTLHENNPFDSYIIFRIHSPSGKFSHHIGRDNKLWIKIDDFFSEYLIEGGIDNDDYWYIDEEGNDEGYVNVDCQNLLNFGDSLRNEFMNENNLIIGNDGRFKYK